MSEQTNGTIRLKVSPEVANIIRGSRELRMEAAQGALSLAADDLLTSLVFLAGGPDEEVRQHALKTLRVLPLDVLAPALGKEGQHPQILDFVARLRWREPEVVESILASPSVSDQTLVRLADRAEGKVLSLIAEKKDRLQRTPDIVRALLDNPGTDREVKVALGWTEDPAEAERPENGEGAEIPEEAAPQEQAEDVPPDEGVEELNLSKYQQALNMEVSEKIKFAMTGDKEWRGIFLKDPNKLVSSAVLKNPRITDGEVLAVAKNKSSNDELIRLITLNREWVKNYEVQKALVMHPRTPLPKALRYMNVLSAKDLKNISKSKAVPTVIANNARRLVIAKEQKK